MSTRNLILLLIPLIVIAGILLSLDAGALSRSEPAAGTASSGVIYDAEVERTVREFGQALKQVSLQADDAQLRASMEAAYGAYVAPSLIEAWLQDPDQAPGRKTSSPWPDSINIAAMQGSGDLFTAHGTVLEVAQGSGGTQIVGTYPVELRLEKRDGAWRITSYEAGAYAPIPARASITGTFTCLPHRNTSGPQTTECAFGLREERTGDHYAVHTMLMSSTDWQTIPTGARVEIEGVMTPIEMISTDLWQKYDIVGIISATTITRR